MSREPSVIEQTEAFHREWEAANPTLVALARAPRPVRAAGVAGCAAQRLLEVARALPQPFTVEALVVAAWVAYPHVFGLRGWAGQYPSDNTVKTYLYGRRGLIGRGFLRKCRTRYEVTS